MSLRHHTGLAFAMALLFAIPAASPLAQDSRKSLKGAAAQAARSAATVTIRVCNRTSDTALVALSYIKVGESRFVNAGWWRIAPGACDDLVDTDNAHFYAYADVDGEDRYWGGSHNLCVEYPGPYEFYSGSGDYCDSDQEVRGFVTMTATETGTYTWNLDP